MRPSRRPARFEATRDTTFARTAVEIALLAVKGAAVPGYRTPATAYGADFILGFDGVRRTDVDGRSQVDV